MKVRIKFRKYGVLKFVGHLDIMRYFQKAMRRADIPIAFSTGFSPHMIMSFAQPLGLGITSQGEYMDIELAEPISSEDAVCQLNEVMVPGVEVVNFRQIAEDKKSSGMTIVAAADYLVLPKEKEECALPENHSKDPVFPMEWQAKIQEFMEQPEIVVLKKTKRSEKEVDIKPMIYHFSLAEKGISMQLATGSEMNLKPELVMEAFVKYLGIEKPSLHYHRVEVFAKNPEGKEPRFVPLDSLGKDIKL